MSWKICHATAFEPEAYLVKGFLEHQGIPCLLEPCRFGMEPVRTGTLGTIGILVPEEWAPVAAKLISHRASRPAHTRGRVIPFDTRRRRRMPATGRKGGIDL